MIQQANQLNLHLRKGVIIYDILFSEQEHLLLTQNIGLLLNFNMKKKIMQQNIQEHLELPE